MLRPSRALVAVVAASALVGCASSAGGTASAACAAPTLHVVDGQDPLVVAGDAVDLRVDALLSECQDVIVDGQSPAPAPTRTIPVLWLQDDLRIEVEGIETSHRGEAIPFTVVVPPEARPGIATIELAHSQVSVVVGDAEAGWGRALWPEPTISLAYLNDEHQPILPGVTVGLTVHDHLLLAPDDSVAWDPLAPPLVASRPAPILWIQDGVEVALRSAEPSIAADARWTVAVPPEAIPGEARIVLGDSEVALTVDD